MKKFWIIWQPGYRPNPSYQHETLHSAEVECERLVREFGGSFYIMEAVGGAKRNDVVPIKFDGSDGEPF